MTTAPMTAIVSSPAVISNGKIHVVKIEWPSWATLVSVLRQRGGRRVLAGEAVLGDADDHQQERGQQRGDADAGQDALADERLLAQVLLAVDAEQHDHEQDQHDDGAGVDDDLHGGEELGVLLEEQHRHAEQRRHQAERRVDRVARDHDPDRAGQHDDRGHDEDAPVDHSVASVAVVGGTAVVVVALPVVHAAILADVAGPPPCGRVIASFVAWSASGARTP